MVINVIRIQAFHDLLGTCFLLVVQIKITYKYLMFKTLHRLKQFSLLIMEYTFNFFPPKKPGEEPPEEDESLRRVDPLHQLILLFSRTALTEKW